MSQVRILPGSPTFLGPEAASDDPALVGEPSVVWNRVPGLAERLDDAVDVECFVIERYGHRVGAHVRSHRRHALHLLDGCTSPRGGAPSDDSRGLQHVAHGLGPGGAGDEQGEQKSGGDGRARDPCHLRSRLFWRFGPIADHLKFAPQTGIGNPGRVAAVRYLVRRKGLGVGPPPTGRTPRLFSIAQKARRVLGSKAVTRSRNPGKSTPVVELRGRYRETKCQANP